MIIKTKTHDIEVSSVASTTFYNDGKKYPALRFTFGGAVTEDDLIALASGELDIGGSIHEGYNTLGEIAVIVGKITSAEQERDALENELAGVKTEHENYKGAVRTILPILDDQTAVSVIHLFPTWEECLEVGAVESDIGYRFSHNGKLYKCKDANPTFQSDWIPGNGTESLYERIDAVHAGTVEDPIPYDGNMALVSGVYYTQDGVMYLCNRDTVNPVHNDLSDLVGHYVEVYTE